jgi:hypothetical protein
MKDLSHFYPRYGLALAMSEKKIHNLEDVQPKDFIDSLLLGLEHFRVKPVTENWETETEVLYTYTKTMEGNPSKGFFLTPSVITSDKSAKGLWGKVEELGKSLATIQQQDLYKKTRVQQSVAPTAGEFNNGAASRKTADISLLEFVCCAITTVSPNKPAYAQITVKDGKPSYSNTTIIPDLPLDDLRKFIRVFDIILKTKTNNLFMGRVSDKDKVKKPMRPAKLFNGNFPHAPQSNALSALSLLGAIGEWAKETKETGLAEEVLEKLEKCPIYIINSDNTRVTNYNHFIVKLAKEGNLNSIIDSLYYVKPYNLSKKIDFKEIEREREKVAFFASRFLHIFDKTSFNEFLAIRAEYPYQLELLFKTYFMETKKIDPLIVASARELGAWLNKVAYLVAKSNAKPDPNSIREAKAKVLVELESSAFSAKSGTALIGQTVTRAGRLSNLEAPHEAALFMEKTMSGDLELKDAQQMLMAFSRLRTKYEPKDTSSDTPEASNTEGVEEDFSAAQ